METFQGKSIRVSHTGKNRYEYRSPYTVYAGTSVEVKRLIEESIKDTRHHLIELTLCAQKLREAAEAEAQVVEPTVTRLPPAAPRLVPPPLEAARSEGAVAAKASASPVAAKEKRREESTRGRAWRGGINATARTKEARKRPTNVITTKPVVDDKPKRRPYGMSYLRSLAAMDAMEPQAQQSA